MSNDFEIEINYRNIQYAFPAILATTGYGYKINVHIFDTVVSFERDDENNFRALLRQEDLQKDHKIEKGLIAAIGNEIESLFRD